MTVTPPLEILNLKSVRSQYLFLQAEVRESDKTLSVSK